MDYCEFCEQIEECIEKMSSYLDEVSEANRRIHIIGLDYDIHMLTDLYKKNKNAMKLIRDRIDKQVEQKITKIRNLGEYEYWKNYFLFLIAKNPNYVEKYEQEHPGKIFHYCAINFMES